MEILNPVQTLYTILGIRQKIQDQKYRIFYLRHVWGLEQKDIGACEGLSQSKISNILREPLGDTDIRNLVMVAYNVDEIKYLHKLPRTVISDAQLVAFVNNILGLNILHPFYSAFQYSDNMRIMALSGLGIRQRQLMKIFDKSQPAISQIIRRGGDKYTNVVIPLRDDVDSSVFAIEFEPPHQSLKFIVSGGNSL